MGSSSRSIRRSPAPPLADAVELEQEREVELARAQPGGDLLGLSLGEAKGDLRVSGPEGRHRQRHDRGARGRERRHRKLAAAKAGDRRDLGLGGVELRQDGIGVRHERLAGARGRAPRRPRSRRVTPISASSAAMDWDTADCVYESESAAAENDPRLATSLKTRRRWGFSISRAY